MTYGTLFSGVEGFGQGFDRAGMRCLWQCEVDKVCQHVLRRHYPGVPLFDDVRAFDPEIVEVPDLIAWGSPCQDLSISGNRAGLDGHKSGLFYEGIRIVSALFRRGSRYTVWENVPGAFSTNGGNDFRCVLEAFVEACSGECVPVPRPKKWIKAGCILGGAWSVAWRVFDAQYFGVPQRRKRIFLVADSRGESAPQILFEQAGGPRDAEESGDKGEADTTCPENRTGEYGVYQWASGGGNELKDTAQSLRANAEASYQVVFRHHPHDSRTVEVKDVMDAVSAHYGTGGNNVPLVVSGEVFNFRRRDGATCGVEEHESGLGTFGKIAERRRRPDVAKTLTCKSTLDPDIETLVPTWNGVRRLTPVECCRLMGWPDDWNEWGIDEKGNKVKISDSQRYKQCGNGVVANVAEWIALRLIGGING